MLEGGRTTVDLPFLLRMLLWLLRGFDPLLDKVSAVASGDSTVFLTTRIAGAAITAFLAALILGRPIIRWLGNRFVERVESASRRLDELHAGKNATPTMGGLFLVAAVVTASVLWGDLTNPLVLLALAITVSYGAIGGIDDWVKLRTTRRGLTVRQKFLAQSVLGIAAGIILWWEYRPISHGLDLLWPVGGHALFLGAMFPAWAALVLVGSSNAVNLTDGLDGLAGGCGVLTAGTMAGLCYVAGHTVWADYLGVPFIPQTGEVAVVLGSLGGALLGFLWFNCHPAQVFMGDTGSLPIGALLGFGALVSRQEILLAIAGGVFVIETLSVVAQVGWFRLTGRRLIACSPLHNHFVLTGHYELKIVVRFWIGSAVLAVLALASLKVR